MQLLRIDHISKSYGSREVLTDVSFGINLGERIALVAPNGAGKTTLLRIIAGALSADSGRLTWLRRGVRIGYLPQVHPAGDPLTVGESLGMAAAAGHRPGQEDRTDEAGRIEEAVRRFGLPTDSLEIPLHRLSGGERTRCCLAGLWLQMADFVLLDEPTNHLDLAGLRWLEQWVAGYRGTVLMVSHDRYFLDRVATRIIALNQGMARSYPGNYTAYRQARAVEIESQLQQYRAEERRARELRAAVIRQANWSEQSHQHAGDKGDSRAAWVYYRQKAEKIAQRGKAITKRLARLEAERVDAPRRTPTFRMALRTVGKTGRFVLAADGLSKSFATPLFQDVSLAVGRGEKVGLVGPNGSGKTTLLRILAGELTADAGSVRSLPSAGLAYLDQHASSLRDDLTPVEEIQQMVANPAVVRTLLGSFLFDEQRALTMIGSLSPGERSRLALLKLLLSPSSLLLLDEPTNHLDLPSREQVETALATYEGAVLVVSHDRYLLQRICPRIIALEAGELRVYHGGYAEYEARTGQAGQGQTPEHVAVAAAVARPEDDRELSARRLVLANRMAVLSGELAKLGQADPSHEATVAEFMATARELRSLDNQKENARRG